jgi:predicted membrane protein
MVVAAILFVLLIVLISVAAFGGGGDAARWAAISTMWLATHVFILEFIFLALLIGMIYLLARLLGIAPVYTHRAQTFARKLAIRLREVQDAAVKPIIDLDSLGASIEALLGRK